MKNTRVLAIWGSPGAGKTATAAKLALELASNRNNVLILMCDFVAPTPQTILPNTSTEGKSLGDILTTPAISQEIILSHCIPFPNNPYISLLGYKSGDNSFSYAKYAKERAVDLMTLLRHIADYVLIDCNSIIAFDVLSAVALENADSVLRLCGCDLKSLSYFSSNLPIIADGRFASERHIKALSAVKPGQDNGEYSNAFGGISYTLPYVPELEEQFYAARLTDELCTKPAESYKAAIRSIMRDILLDEGGELKPKKGVPVIFQAKTTIAESPNVKKAINPLSRRARLLRSPGSEPEKTGGGLFDRLRNGGNS